MVNLWKFITELELVMIKNVALKNLLSNSIFRFFSAINIVLPKNDNMILLYSNIEYRDNIKTMCEYLIENGYQKKYKIILSANDKPKNVPSGIEVVGNVSGILKYLRAGHVYYAFGKLPIYPTKKQCVIQMWHGTPFKGIDKGMETVSKRKSYLTYAFVSSEFFINIGCKLFSCKKGNIAICGQPRTDVMFGQEKKYKEVATYRKFILWMPTFRKSSILGYDDIENQNSIVPIFDREGLCRLNGTLKEKNIGLVIKLHPSQDLSKYKKLSLSHIYLLSHDEFKRKGFDLYKLIGQADSLITDYSSVFYDFLMMDRPIAFTLDDVDEYGSSRGFFVDNPEEFFDAWHRIYNEKDFYQYVNDIAEDKDVYRKQRNKMNRLVNKYTDHQNRKRALEISNISL